MATALKHGTQLHNQYDLLSVIGQGGFGITYLADDKSTMETVAIKELFIREIMERSDDSDKVFMSNEEDAPDFAKYKEDMKREAELLTKLQSFRHVVHILDIFEENDTVYMVMPFVPGIDLRKYLDTYGTFSPEDAFKRLMPILEELTEIHALKLIHRDINPDNIRVTPDGQFILMDFGASRNFEGKTHLSRVLKDGYAPVEQVSGNGKQGPWTDIYSFCATLYEMITGNIPDESISRMLYDELKKPSALGIVMEPELEAILMKGLSVYPENRYASFTEMKQELDTIESRKKKKKIHTIAAVSIAAVILLFFAGWRYRLGYIYDPQRDYRIHLYYNEMPEESRKEIMETVNKRLSIFAGRGKYDLKQTEDGAILYIDRSVYHNQPYIRTTKLMLTRPTEIFLADENGKEDDPDTHNCKTIDREDIKDIRIVHGSIPDVFALDYGILTGEYDYLEVTLSDSVMEDLKTGAWSGSFSFYQDILMKNVDHYKYDTFYDPQEEIFRLIVPGGASNMAKTVFYNWTHDPMPDSLGVEEDYGQKTTWQNAETTVTRGKHQVQAADLGADSVVIALTTSSAITTLTNGNLLDTEEILKERLDALNTPYAFGSYQEKGETCFTIQLPNDHVGIPVICVLKSGSYCYLNTGFASLYLPLYGLQAEICEKEDQTFALRLSLTDESDQEQLKRMKEYMKENNLSELILGVSECQILRASIASIYDNGVIEFEYLADNAATRLGKDQSDLLRIFAAVVNQITTYSYYPVSTNLTGQIFVSEDGSYGITDITRERYTDLADKIVEVDENVGISVKGDSTGDILYIRLHLPADAEFPQKMEAQLTQIMKLIDMEKLPLQHIYFYPVDIVNDDESCYLHLYKNRMNMSSTDDLRDRSGKEKIVGEYSMDGERLLPYGEAFEQACRDFYEKNMSEKFE